MRAEIIYDGLDAWCGIAVEPGDLDTDFYLEFYAMLACAVQLLDLLNGARHRYDDIVVLVGRGYLVEELDEF